MRVFKRWSWRLAGLVTIATFLAGAGLVGVGPQPRLAHANGTTYYLDASGGNDSNDGQGQSSAWQTLAKVNATTFGPGDQLLLKAGEAWTGQFWPKGSGSSGSPIIVDQYGSGAKPLIQGEGNVNETVRLYNQEYWELNNLEVTNSGSDGTHAAIKATNENAGTLHHIHIAGMDVHDVTGDDNDKNTGGIFVGVLGTSTVSVWDDVLIENNYVHSVYRSGIKTFSTWINNNGNGRHPSTNVRVQNNTVSNTGGDGILVLGADSPLVQYNTSNGANQHGVGYNVGIWTFETNNATVQYNESYNTKLPGDSEGFDIDYEQSDTVVQYNYSHDNEGGFVLLMGEGLGTVSTGGIVRYNISQNDGSGVVVFSQGVPQSASIYNNTFYVGSDSSTKIIRTQDGTSTTTSRSYNFFNNLIYNLGSGDYDSTAGSFDYNLFYGNHPSGEPTDPHKLTTDPKLVNPGSGGTGRSSVGGYKLQSGSPAIGAGTLISGNGGQDYWGNSVSSSSAPNIGAYNGSGE